MPHGATPPDETRGQLLVRLVLQVAVSVSESLGVAAEARRRRLDAVSGTHTGLYPAGYLDELRGDWPE